MDLFKQYDGFIVLDQAAQKLYKGRYIKGVNHTRAEDAVIAKLMKESDSPANFGVYGFIRKGEWGKSTAEEV